MYVYVYLWHKYGACGLCTYPIKKKTGRASHVFFYPWALGDSDERNGGRRYVIRRECAIGNRSVSLHGPSEVDRPCLVGKSFSFGYGNIFICIVIIV